MTRLEKQISMIVAAMDLEIAQRELLQAQIELAVTLAKRATSEGN